MIGFETPELLLLTLAFIPFIYSSLKKDEQFKKILGVSKIFTFTLIIVALAGPFVQMEDSMDENPELVLLEDRSYSTELLQDPELEFENVEVSRRVAASGNSSDLRTGLLRNLEEETNYLLLSDLQSSEDLEDVPERFRAENSTLNLLRTDTHTDNSVTVKGPESTVPGAENVYRIEVHSTIEDIPEPQVRLGGQTVELEKEDENTWKFQHVFDNQGVHEIEAEIFSDGYFEDNQEYYKAVDVREKPEILVLGDEGSLGPQLESFYNIDYSQTIPEDLSSYYSVIAKQAFDETEMVSYVAEGNGLVYTGDIEEDYGILPVRPTEDDTDDGAKIVIAIDISPSVGECANEEVIDGQRVCTEHQTEGGAVEDSIEIAYSLVDQLPYNNEVGVVAYDMDPYVISEPKPLAYNREEIKDSISRLETDKTSFHHEGLRGAEEVLGDEGNIIMITDGQISRYGQRVNTEEESRRIASNLGVQLITVGVGDNINENFLRDLADLGNGFYLNADDTSRLSFMFDAGGAEDRGGRLVVLNPGHFITDGLDVSARTLGYDTVEPKLGSDQLVSSTNGQPFLTTWMYGLGRVAAFSGDDTDLSNTLSQDPELVTRSVSWTVGRTERKQDEWLTIESAREGETVEARSSNRLEGLTRESEDVYTGELEPGSLGFHDFNGKTYAYNYNEEIERIGYNEENEDIVTGTGGRVFYPGEELEIEELAESMSERTVYTKKPLNSYLLALALIIFLSEVGYRKLRGRK